MTEYHDAMVTMLELIWGEGYMAPGGAGNVARMVRGLELGDRRVLDIGCGLGGPACELAETYGARVTGIDLEAPLVERARARAAHRGLADRVEFLTVEAGPLGFDAASFDVVFSSGAFTQVEDKHAMFRECARVLAPGGALTCYDWMKAEGAYSDEMRDWFELEGLTYAMQTLERHGEILAELGFRDIELEDASAWYRRRVRQEYERMKGGLYPRMQALLGAEQAAHFLENWRAMVVVCERGEMRQGYYRARRPL